MEGEGEGEGESTASGEGRGIPEKIIAVCLRSVITSCFYFFIKSKD